MRRIAYFEDIAELLLGFISVSSVEFLHCFAPDGKPYAEIQETDVQLTNMGSDGKRDSRKKVKTIL